jgi:hypothetical protein
LEAGQKPPKYTGCWNLSENFGLGIGKSTVDGANLPHIILKLNVTREERGIK